MVCSEPLDPEERQAWFREMWEGDGKELTERQQLEEEKADEDDAEDDDFGDDFDEFAEGGEGEDFGDFDDADATPMPQASQQQATSQPAAPDILAGLVSSPTYQKTFPRDSIFLTLSTAPPKPLQPLPCLNVRSLHPLPRRHLPLLPRKANPNTPLRPSSINTHPFPLPPLPLPLATTRPTTPHATTQLDPLPHPPPLPRLPRRARRFRRDPTPQQAEATRAPQHQPRLLASSLNSA